MRATRLVLPLYLQNEMIREEDGRQPYRELTVTVTVQPPCIVVRPPRILLTPVPLASEASAIITLLATGYPELVPARSRCFAIKRPCPNNPSKVRLDSTKLNCIENNIDSNFVFRCCVVVELN